MNSPNEPVSHSTVFNLPNQLTSLRLLLAVVMFVLLSVGQEAAVIYLICLILFLLAAGTDWLDGYYARKYDQVTTLGRILDPFADKVIICGTFIFLVAEPGLTEWWYGLKAWMVVVVVGRELLVTALRGFLEQKGADFSANWPGKLKMGFQCGAAGTAFFYLWLMTGYAGVTHSMVVGLTNLAWVAMIALFWITVILTVYSGWIYVLAAIRLLKDIRHS